MMRELVERAIVDGFMTPHPVRLKGESDLSRKGRGAGRSVTVNIKESPLSWLKARGLVDARQFEAGERLRADYERASIAPSVTMKWDAVRGKSESLDPTTAQIAAKRRFDDAVGALGPGLRDIAWRTVCACDPLPTSEKALGWPARSGRLVLTLALDRLADHYQLP